MKKTALRLSSLALGLALTGMIAPSGFAVEATTDPVGYYTIPFSGASDNVLSLPMVRDAVFAGTVDTSTPATASSFTAKAGSVSPGWTVNQFAYAASTQPLTYYVEFTGATTDAAGVNTLRGAAYRILSNTANSLTLVMESDSLLAHTIPTAAGGTVNASIANGDSFKIRPYWRLRDVLQNGATPLITPRPDEFTVRDDVLFPNYNSVNVNKAPSEGYYFLQGAGWRQISGDPDEDLGDRILAPNEAFIIRRRTATGGSITNLGGVSTNRNVSFVPGGNGTKANDIYISLNRPAAVTLDASGLHSANEALSVIKSSPDTFSVTDRLLAFGNGTGFNRAPSSAYFYVAGAGGGWREVSNEDDTTVGATVKLEPGKVYIIRKLKTNSGADWVNEPNY
jgi:uncharacterized protein (TIGR02597 family)